MFLINIFSLLIEMVLENYKYYLFIHLTFTLHLMAVYSP